MDVLNLHKIFLQQNKICTDTRKIESGCIFFALKGDKFNGNAFAYEALQKGAVYAVIDDEKYAVSDKCIVVSDALKALQQLSKYHRSLFNIPVIAIVGSNGKTTTKELISNVLQQRFKVLSTPGNFNNHIGLPLTLLMLEPNTEIAVIELGANHIGENAFLCELAMPTHGLITNNGKDHLEGFGSLEGVAKSNSELFYHLLKHNGHAFVNANDEWITRMASRINQKTTYAANWDKVQTNADVVGFAKSLQPQILFEFDQTSISSYLSGDYNFTNIMAAVAVGKHFGLSTNEIKNGIENYKPQNLRSQLLETAKNKIFLDAYNANPSSMEAGLRNFAHMPHASKWVILGDMFELGTFASAEHQNISDLCKQFAFEKVLLVGNHFCETTSNFTKFKTTDECRVFLENEKPENKYIFIKGSRGMKLETLTDVL